MSSLRHILGVASSTGISVGIFILMKQIGCRATYGGACPDDLDSSWGMPLLVPFAATIILFAAAMVITAMGVKWVFPGIILSIGIGVFCAGISAPSPAGAISFILGTVLFLAGLVGLTVVYQMERSAAHAGPGRHRGQ
ncbi:hypothetical protein ACIGBL_34480 [Streptomyces sp. NPDC085614]|uniref:hypothetical protein n=1 Tax=Streptomyces sp. NPDC085614 TaxID=3365733 RepID=UPI0037CD9DC7